MRIHAGSGLLVLAAFGLVVGVARADGVAPEQGIEARSGAKIRTAVSPAGDVDDALFVGVPGQRVRARFRSEARADEPVLAGRLTLLDPEGAVLWTGDGAKLRLDARLTSTGLHTLRVEGTENGAVGRYRLDVAHTPPRKTKEKRDGGTPGEVVFELPAGPGVEVAFVLSWRRGELELAGIDDPSGAPVPLLEQGVTTKRRSLRLAATRLPAGAAVGTYRVRCTSSAEAPAAALRFVPRVRLERLTGRARKLDLAAAEPRFVLVPPGAVPGERLSFLVLNPLDPDEDALPRVFLGGRELLGVDVPSPQTVSALVPLDFPLGVHGVTLRTRTGQVARAESDVELVTRPRVTAIAPDQGPEQGGFEVELRGQDLPPRERLAVTLNGFALSSEAILEVGAGRVLFRAPARVPGDVAFGVVDRPTEIGSSTFPANFAYRPVPALDAVAPSITPVLGGATIELRGAGFAASDRVLLERADGSLESLSGTFVSGNVHRFDAPPRAAGAYVVVVENAEGFRNAIRRELRYFRFVDVTAAAGLDSVQGDVLDAVTSATVDFDRDDDLDLVLSAAGGDTASSRSLTRVLRNDDGVFTDVTLDVLPPVTSTEDWRADAVSTGDVDGDGWADLFLASNHEGVLASNVSHVRILRNVAPQPGVPGARAFVDTTLDWMAPPRMKVPFSFNQAPPEIADAWRAQDMWVGDLDADGGPPDIVIVHDERKTEPNTHCTNYCVTPVGPGATYNFYWGGTRVFGWDATARSGLGRFRFDADAVPRRAGVGVALGLPNVPALILGCYNGWCADKFTPFTGERLAVGDVDGDGRLDIAVVTTGDLVVDGTTASSLQVALRTTSGAGFVDVTKALTALGRPLGARSVAIAALEGRGGRGSIAVTSPVAPNDGTRALRLVRFVDPDSGSAVPAAFEDLTSLLPPVIGGDALQADALRVADVDGNGRDDLVLLSADANPFAGGPALRLVLSTRLADGGTRLAPAWGDLLASLVGTGESLEGGTLTLGDLAGDGLPTFVLSRTSPTGAATETRTIRMSTED